METINEWLKKEEAAKLLSRGGAGRISPRRALELVQEGKLQAKRERNPDTSQITTYISKESVDRLYHERKHPKPIDVKPEGANGAIPQRSQALALPKQALQQELMARFLPRPPLPLFLSIRAAAKHSGLPQTYLHELIDSGKLPAHKTGAGWRVSRAQLKQLAEIR